MSEHYAVIENIVSAQTPKTLEVFEKIIKEFDLILEIGTYRGAFTMWLYNNKKEGAKFKTYEANKDFIEIPMEKREEIDIMITNCFSKECLDDVINLINTHGRTLILCDGGDKNTEFKTFSQYIKPQDVIMLHDFTQNSQDSTEFDKYRELRNWPHWAESSYDAIEEAVKENELEGFLYDEFKSVFWGSFIKK